MFRVELFSNAACDASGNGEGRTFLGFQNVTTDGFGNASINQTVGATAVGETVTATATDPFGNTSEFSACIGVTAGAQTFTVTNTNDSGAGSLRQAITSANASTGTTDTIAFNIAGAGVKTIAPTSALPDITDPVIIDGYTQPGASANTLAVGNNAVLLIELNGASAGAGVQGLVIRGGGSTVRGLVINRFQSHGIKIDTNGGNIIQGNFIGTNAAGNAALGNSLDRNKGHLVRTTLWAARRPLRATSSPETARSASTLTVRLPTSFRATISAPTRAALPRSAMASPESASVLRPATPSAARLPARAISSPTIPSAYRSD